MQRYFILKAMALCMSFFISSDVHAGELKNPVWKQMPTPEELKLGYPVRESPDEIEVNVELDCLIVDSSGHINCRIVSETPKNQGYGAYAARLWEQYGLVDMQASSKAKPGKHLRLKFKIIMA